MLIYVWELLFIVSPLSETPHFKIPTWDSQTHCANETQLFPEHIFPWKSLYFLPAWEETTSLDLWLRIFGPHCPSQSFQCFRKETGVCSSTKASATVDHELGTGFHLVWLPFLPYKTFAFPSFPMATSLPFCKNLINLPVRKIPWNKPAVRCY